MPDPLTGETIPVWYYGNAFHYEGSKGLVNAGVDKAAYDWVGHNCWWKDWSYNLNLENE